MKKIVLNGKKMFDLHSFYKEIQENLTKDLPFKMGSNLDALYDILEDRLEESFIMVNALNKNISIDESIGFDKEGNVITFLDILKTPKPDFALDLYKQDSLQLLKEYFNVLTEREKEIIIKRYGLDGKDEITQKEIAKEFGISRSYVSRIEKRALVKLLREFMKNKNV